MNWLARYHLRNYLRNSLWVVPTLAILMAMLVSPVVRWFDESRRWRLLEYAPDGARALLSAIAPATLTLIALVLSTLLLAVQLASSQMSPRLIAGALAQRQVKICLAIFVFSYTYVVGVLGRIEDRAPQLPTSVAIVSTLASIVAGLYLIDFMAKELRPVRMLARTAKEGRGVIEAVYPTLLAEQPGQLDHHQAPEPRGSYETINHTGQSSVWLAMNVPALIDAARAADRVIELVPQVGDFVAKGDQLFRVFPTVGSLKVSQLRNAVAFGPERTADQDPSFAFRIIVDIACKALSPAINDPTTAVLAIDQIHQLLRQVGLRRLDMGETTDAQGRPRLIYRTPNWEDFVLLAVTEIRQYGCNSIQVARRLRAMLENLLAALPSERAPALHEQLALLHSGVERGFNEPADRLRASASDYQGVGGTRLTPSPSLDSPAGVRPDSTD